MAISSAVRPRWAGAAALVVALLGCSADGPASQPARTLPGEVSPSTTAPTAPTTPSTMPTPTSTQPTALDRTLETGEIEVAVTTRLPTLPVEWSASALELSDGSDTWLAHVALAGDIYVAVAFGWDASGRQVVTTWRSVDGTTWASDSITLPEGASMYDIATFGDRLFATGHQQAEDRSEPRLWWMGADEGEWTDVDLPVAETDLGQMWLAGVAVNEAGLLVAGRRDHYEPSRPVAFEAKGYRYEQNDAAGTYELSEAATGRVVASGRTDELYGWDPDGHPVYDPVTAERLAVVPWDAWEQPPVRSPLPIPSPADFAPPEPFVVVVDGFRITLDENDDRFEVVDVATGVVVTSGTATDFYRGRSPRFVDEATSEIAAVFSWDEWDELMGSAYEAQWDEHVEHESELLAMFSPDGVEWSTVELEADPNRHLDSVVAIGGVFVLTIVGHGESGESRWVLTSSDGVAWERSEPQPGRYVYATEAGGAGAIGLSWTEAGSTIATSIDGRVWTNDLTLGTQSDGRSGGFDSVSAGDRVVAALATLYTEPSRSTLTISAGSRTARFDVDGAAVEITDDLSGAVLLRASWDDLQRAAQGEIPMIADYADEATRFYADAKLVMSIPDDAVHAAFEEAAEEERAGIDHVVFLRAGGGWYEIAVPHVDGSTAGPLAVGDGVIITALTTYDEPVYWEATDGEGEVTIERIEVLIGRFETPAG